MQENNGGNNNQKQGGLSWSMPSSSPAPVQKPAQTPLKVSVSANTPATVTWSSAWYVGMVVIGVIAGVIIAWGWVALRSPANETATATATTTVNDLGVNTTTVPTLGFDPALTVMSPQSAGMSVAIAKVVVSSPTWVVIYENKEGKPGNALGAALFFPESQSGTVELLRSTLPGKTYLVAKQVDNGDRKFSLKGDQFLSEGGVVQWVSFETK